MNSSRPSSSSYGVPGEAEATVAAPQEEEEAMVVDLAEEEEAAVVAVEEDVEDRNLNKNWNA
jgi:hypothetical protein